MTNVKPTTKPGLTMAMQMIRLEWALAHQHWTLEDWKNVIWSGRCGLHGNPGSMDDRLTGGVISRIFRAPFVDGFIPRLIRAYLQSRAIDAQSSWAAFMNHLEDQVRPDYIRMNPFYEVERMLNLPRQVCSYFNSRNDCPVAARALWAAQLFFEPARKCTY
jgi:hypothetical protein